MSSDLAVRYDVRLSLTGLPADGAHQVQAAIEKALSEAIPEGSVTLESVTERRVPLQRYLVEEKITPLSALYLALPAEFWRPDILDTLALHYHRELACLWRSVQDDCCVQGVIALHPWRQAGSQWICEFESFDLSVPVRNEYNFHFQNTSRWSNSETG